LPTAGFEVERVIEGVIAGVVLLIVLAVVAAKAARTWQARRQQAKVVPGIPALARFTDTEITDAKTFGGGAWSARVRRRRDTVTYGYLAVAEEHFSADSGSGWCTLTVTLPGRVPFLVVDNRASTGRPGVPLDAPHRVSLDDPPFDATYLVGAAEPDRVERVLSPAVREVLLRAPVQRMMLHDSQVLLRTLDGVSLDDAAIEWLDSLAARILSSTPSFVTSARQPAPPTGAGFALDSGDAPLPEGLYGPGGE
jgi:hypothetical protein